MRKTFPLQLNDDLHKQMKHASFDAGQTLHDWVLSAITQRLGTESSEIKKGNHGSNSGKTKKVKKNNARS